MTKIIDGNFESLRLVEHLKVDLRIEHFDHFFFFSFFFSSGWLRGGCFILGLTQQKWLYF